MYRGRRITGNPHGMTGRKTPQYWWHDILRGERYSSAEWLMLGVSAIALTGAMVVLARVLA